MLCLNLLSLLFSKSWSWLSLRLFCFVFDVLNILRLRPIAGFSMSIPGLDIKIFCWWYDSWWLIQGETRLIKLLLQGYLQGLFWTFTALCLLKILFGCNSSCILKRFWQYISRRILAAPRENRQIQYLKGRTNRNPNSNFILSKTKRY